MIKKQVNVTLASYNYLHEVSAIPSDTRNEYLSILSKRKGKSSQKSVKFLKIIYFYVDENKISEWNPYEICELLRISMNMLYCHKSRLLKGLREHYFKWNEAEKEIIEAVYKINKVKEKAEEAVKKEDNIFDYNDEEYSTRLMLEKARKMAELGMMREAKNNFRKLEKQIKGGKLRLTEKYEVLSEIYDFMSYYYVNRRNRKKLQYYSDKLNKTLRTVKNLNLNISAKQNGLFNIRLNYSKFYLYSLKWYGNPKAKIANEYHKKIYDLSKKINNNLYLLKVLHSIVIMEIVKGNLTKAEDFCLEGYKISNNLNKKTEMYTFASMLYYIKTRTKIKNTGLNNDNILKYYYQIKKKAPLILWTIYLENSLSMTDYPYKRKEKLGVFRNQINSNIMLGDLLFSVYWKFILDSELYNDRLLLFFNYNDIKLKQYPELDKVDGNLLNNIEKICLNTECYHKRLNDFGLIWETRKFQLTAYYFMEDNTNIEKVTPLINKMERMKKSDKIVSALNTFELLKISFRFLEYSDRVNTMLRKYEYKLKTIIDDFKKSPSEYNIIDYAILSSLSRRLKCKEITAMVIDLYHWLETKHPEILGPAFRAVKEKENKIYTVTGGAAA